MLLTQSRRGYLINVEILSEEGALLRGRLPAVIGQDVSEGCHRVLRLGQGEGLPADGEVDVVLCQGPAPLLVNLHGLAVAAQRVPPLHAETEDRPGDRTHQPGAEYTETGPGTGHISQGRKMRRQAQGQDASARGRRCGDRPRDRMHQPGAEDTETQQHRRRQDKKSLVMIPHWSG